MNTKAQTKITKLITFFATVFLCCMVALIPAQPASAAISARSFRHRGVVRWHGYTYTYYSQKVLPGRGLRIPGRHVDRHGYVCDRKGYIVLASGTIKKHKVVRTPFGKRGKIYDFCPRGGKIIDVYTNF